MERFDLAVVGAGPAGHFGAIQAAKLGKRVAIVEAASRPGGAGAVTGTLPSKSLREATLHLTGLRQRAFYGEHYRVKHDLTIDDLMRSAGQIVEHETGVLTHQLRRNGVKMVRGSASFLSPTRLEISDGSASRLLEADHILLAVGSRPARPPGLDFDGETIIDSNQILSLSRIPQRLVVVGAGVIGLEYACIFAALGAKVIVINQREDFLEFVDRQIVETLKHHMQSRGVEFRLGEEVVSLEQWTPGVVVAATASGKKIAGDCLLYSVGRQGATDGLNLAAAGLSADSRGRLAVNERFQTAVEHIYAAGDVIGFPALAATSREQGRAAVRCAFECSVCEPAAHIPYGVYTIPEISMIGPTEQALTKEGVAYEVGVARYREIARGQILGDHHGLLKLLFEPGSRKLLAAHIIGDGATELIHIAQAAQALGATIDYFIDTVFNYPTLAECYKVAALDGANRLALLEGAETKSAKGVSGATEASRQDKALNNADDARLAA